MEDFIPIPETKISGETQRARDQIRLNILKQEQQQYTDPQSQKALSSEIQTTQGKDYSKWVGGNPDFIPIQDDTPDFIPIEGSAPFGGTNPIGDLSRGMDYAKGFASAGIKTIVGGAAAGGQVIQKAVSDPIKLMGSYLGLNDKPDTSNAEWQRVVNRGAQAPENIVPGLKSIEPGAQQFDTDFEHLMEYLRTKSDKFAQNIPGIKQLYKMNPNLGYTLATSAPDVLLTLSMAIGLGKPGLTKAIAETKDINTARTIADSLKVGEKVQKPQPQSEPYQQEFPGMGEEQMHRAPQYGSDQPGGFRSIDENGMPFNATRTQDLVTQIGGDPLAGFKGSKEDFLRQVEREAKNEKLQEDVLFSKHEAEQRKISIQRQLEISANTPETSIKESLKKSIGIEGDYTSLLHTFGDKEMRPDFLDRFILGIKDFPTEQLKRVNENLKKRVDKISFEDKTTASYKLINQYNRVDGELKKRQNDLALSKNIEEAKKSWPDVGQTVDFTMDRGTGYENSFTGKVIKWSDPDHVYVKDNLTERVYQLNGHEIDKIYTGPVGIIYLNTFGPKMNREAADGISNLLFGARKETPKEAIDLLKQALPESQQTGDILPGFQASLANAHWRSHNRAIYGLGKPRSFATLLAVYNDNQIRLGVKQEHALNAEAVQKASDPMRLYYNMQGLAPGIIPGSTPKYNLFKKDISIILDMERDSKEWFNGTEYYPPDDYFISKGMDPKSISIWRNIFEMEGKMYERVNETMVNNGRSEIPKRPGYVHHGWTGPYRVEMYKNIYDKDGNIVREEYVGKISEFSAKKRDTAYDYMKSIAKDSEVVLKKEDPQAEGTNYSGYIEDYQKMLSRFDNSPGLRKIVENLYGSAVKGIITESMARKDPAVFGHILERASWDQNNILGLSNKEMIDAMDMTRRHFEDVNGFYVRSQYVKNVLLPLVESKYLSKWPNLEREVTKQALQFLQIPEGVNRILSVALRGLAIAFGKDPGIARDIVNTGTKGIALAYLMFRMPYYIANLGQRTNSAFYLKTIKIQQEALGAKTGDIGKAYSDTIKDGGSFFSKLSEDNLKLPLYLREGIKYGHIDPGFNELITPGKVRDPVAMAIERRNRAAPFMLGYNYAKQFMSHEDALGFAGKNADAIGVPYHPQFGPQLMLENLDPIMKPMVMFTNFSSHMMSMSNNMIYTASSLLKEGKPGPALKAISQLAGWQLTAATLFGVNAINGIGNLGDIINWYNLNTDSDIPTPQELALKLNKYLPEFMRGVPSFGAISAAIGYNVSGSGSGVNAQLPTAGVNAILSVVMHTVLFGKMFMYYTGVSNKPVTKKDWNVAKKLSPGNIAGFDEYMIKYGGRADKMAMDLVTGNFPSNPGMRFKRDTSMENDPTLQGSPRNKLDSLVYLLQGVRSIRESTESIAENLTKHEHANLVSVFSSIAQSSKENGKISARDMDTILGYAKTYGPERTEGVILALIDSQFTSSLTKNERKIFEALDSIEQLKFFEKYRSRLKLGIGK